MKKQPAKPPKVTKWSTPPHLKALGDTIAGLCLPEAMLLMDYLVSTHHISLSFTLGKLSPSLPTPSEAK